MKKLSIINIDKAVVKQLIEYILSTTPGVETTKPINVEIKHNIAPIINVRCYFKKYITNLYDICKEIQNILYYKLIHDFDLSNITINVFAE